MWRLAFLLLALASFENFRLYLTDGSFHMVREYKVEEDRVRYYSIERGDWEELPLTLVDLKKTEAERGKRAEEEKRRAALEDAEEKFERAAAAEIAKIPQEPGIYFVHENKLVTVPAAEIKVVSDKKRSILKVLTPIPIVPGKARLEVEKEHAAISAPSAMPNFYFRIAESQRFGIVRMKPLKGARQVAIWQMEPVSKQVFFEMDLIEIFRQQLRGDLYKFWPQKDLAPGEYAVVQYTEGEGYIQAWDFRVEGKPDAR
ncbi:MAG: hypothetical protein HXY18_10455 [Bryobacteraceae bacterium]|jgi:hypothetical protein|nr:hypothetical protein [Bryobacteraceae bacterium]